MSKKSKKRHAANGKLGEILSNVDTELGRIADEEVRAVEGLSDPTEKAHAWLTQVEFDLDSFIDQEALVYLASRGHDVTDHAERIIRMWDKAIEDTRERASQIHYSTIDGTDENDARDRRMTKQARSFVASEIRDKQVSEIPYHILKDFWWAANFGHYVVDATMLRVAEWYNIRRYDQWWRRLAEEAQQDAKRGGQPTVEGIAWLFAMSRSTLACDIIGQLTLERLLDQAEVPPLRSMPPWFIYRSAFHDYSHCVLYAAMFSFVHSRVRGEGRTTLQEESTQFILHEQREDGGWPYWTKATIWPMGHSPDPSLPELRDPKRAEKDDKSDVLATAVAVHALAMTQPTGWRRALDNAATYLWSQQGAGGYWYEPGESTAWLTVLVLDALELAKGGTHLTFNISTNAGDGSPEVEKRTVPMTLRQAKELFGYRSNNGIKGQAKRIGLQSNARGSWTFLLSAMTSEQRRVYDADLDAGLYSTSGKRL